MRFNVSQQPAKHREHLTTERCSVTCRVDWKPSSSSEGQTQAQRSWDPIRDTEEPQMWGREVPLLEGREAYHWQGRAMRSQPQLVVEQLSFPQLRC